VAGAAPVGMGGQPRFERLWSVGDKCRRQFDMALVPFDVRPSRAILLDDTTV
jgi:hypothetical protein